LEPGDALFACLKVRIDRGTSWLVNQFIDNKSLRKYADRLESFATKIAPTVGYAMPNLFVVEQNKP
jgi:hypothetical protein